jgi:hypothetical protein
MSEKHTRITTPIGEAKWAHVHQPKAAFLDERGQPKGEPKYQIDVVFSVEDLAWKEWAGNIKKQIDALPAQTDKRTGQALAKQMPIKRELDINDQPTGKFYCTFKTGSKYAPKVFDKFGKEIPKDIMIGNGSKVCVNCTPAPYTAFGGGIALYLNAVQVLDLVEYGNKSADAYGFSVDTNTAAPAPAEEDLPF